MYFVKLVKNNANRFSRLRRDRLGCVGAGECDAQTRKQAEWHIHGKTASSCSLYTRIYVLNVSLLVPRKSLFTFLHTCFCACSQTKIETKDEIIEHLGVCALEQLAWVHSVALTMSYVCASDLEGDCSAVAIRQRHGNIWNQVSRLLNLFFLSTVFLSPDPSANCVTFLRAHVSNDIDMDDSSSISDSETTYRSIS